MYTYVVYVYRYRITLNICLPNWLLGFVIWFGGVSAANYGEWSMHK